MQDLDLAKKQLYEKQLNLVISKNGQVLFKQIPIESQVSIDAIDDLGAELNGASVADKVAGKALALLCIYTGIREVYAEVLSKKAQVLFEENNMPYQWQLLVDNVLDVNKTGLCPFEKAAADILAQKNPTKYSRH